MKFVIGALALVLSVPAFAAVQREEAVKNNLEVKSVISAFETNRGQLCSKDTEAKIRISKDGKVKMTVACNQYDQNGEPMANVNIITIRGYVYGNQFDMVSVSIIGQE